MIRKFFGSLLGPKAEGNSANLNQSLMNSTAVGSEMGDFFPSLVDNPFSSETIN